MTTHKIMLAAPPGVITVMAGDQIAVVTEFDYVGPAIGGAVYTALYVPTWQDPHNEIATQQLSFSLPDSPEPGMHARVTIRLTVPAGFEGSNFGLYSKIIDIPGADIFSPFYDNIIEIRTTPVYEAPTVRTLSPTNVGGDSADLWGELVSPGSHDTARCWLEWGTTQNYGQETWPKDLRAGEKFTTKLSNLMPNTTYHYRAVASTTLGDDYGDDKSFTTKIIVTSGFQMRVINMPTGATMWRAGAVGAQPFMTYFESPSYVWKYDELVPEYEVDFYINAVDNAYQSIRNYRFDFQFRNGKKYVFDFGAYYPGIPDLRLMMKEE